MSVALDVVGLGKQYRIGHAAEPYKTLRETLVRVATAPNRRIWSLARGEVSRRGSRDTFWALRDVSFTVQQGEVVGIIGRNGAGKSTLLRILSRITEPTLGYADLHGRVGSLLEVGTGFHPELTGRENIYLNGAILGMRRAEINRKFEQIVEFAEVARFLDTPVKHYSSGMYVRLAFAVAAHLEPDILVVDEVLAVGDASFQKKCLNAMEDVSQHGRTVLFVSHDMSAITRLCPRTVLLDEGQVIADGPSHQVVHRYLQSGLGTTALREWSDPSRAPGDDISRLRSVRIRTEAGHTAETLDIGSPVGLEIVFDVLQPGHVLLPNFYLLNEQGVTAFVALDSDPAWRRRFRTPGQYRSIAWIPANFLAEGGFTADVYISSVDPVHVHAAELHAVSFYVRDAADGSTARGDYAGPMPGVVRPLLTWDTSVEGVER